MKGSMDRMFLIVVALLLIGSPIGVLKEPPGEFNIFGPSSLFINGNSSPVIPPDDVTNPGRELLEFKNFLKNKEIALIDEYNPKYSAGVIITKDDGDLLLITEYLPETNRYCTRVLRVAYNEYLYLTKDGSFMQLGDQCDSIESIEFKYPYLYDDLNENTNENSGDYCNTTRNDMRIYIKYEKEGGMKNEGYLIPYTSESMKHVVTV